MNEIPITFAYANRIRKQSSTGPQLSKETRRRPQPIKPEAVYFAPIEGERGIYMIVNLPSADMIAGIAEPLWIMFNCKLDLTPLMELSDLQKGLQKK